MFIRTIIKSALPLTTKKKQHSSFGTYLENEFFCIKNLSVNKSENLHAALPDDNRHSSRG
jgi:hypothetical protein